MTCTTCNSNTVTMRNEYGNVCIDCNTYIALRSIEMQSLKREIAFDIGEAGYHYWPNAHSALLAEWEGEYPNEGIYIPAID